MAIWRYEDQAERGVMGQVGSQCPYCKHRLKNLKHRTGTEKDHSVSMAFLSVSDSIRVKTCALCGFWVVSQNLEEEESTGLYVKYLQAVGSLKQMDDSDISDPLQELQASLIKDYAKRYELHPRKYEELVGSVFQGIGYEVNVTSYSGDEGIDLFVLDGQSNDQVGVQVKRYKGKIEAEQIRAFVGAMVLKGLTRGIFVTTSDFRRGAKTTAEASSKLGLPVVLWNADTFYEKLSLARREAYRFIEDPSAPFMKVFDNLQGMQMVHQETYHYE